jgi:transcriptional regulator with XRE-family HTH domain
VIKNERQYKITKAQIQRFEQALRDFAKEQLTLKGVDPIFKSGHREALQSQLESLEAEVAEYEALQAGNQKVFEVDSLDILPAALIKARIAAGLTQKMLADRLGLKEQQIQRYEASEYSAASLSRLAAVIKALGVHVREGIVLPGSVSLETILKRLGKLGFDKDFVLRRLISPALQTQLQEAGAQEALVIRVAAAIARILGLRVEDLFGRDQLHLNQAALFTARLKARANADMRYMSAYAVYAHYLAMRVLDAIEPSPQALPTDPKEVAKKLRASGGMTFENVLRFVWSCGVPVLPLQDARAFNGACWRLDHRNVIVLKRNTASPARWTFDVLHEFRHAGQAPDQSSLSIIDTSAIAQDQIDVDAEEEASTFAGDVLLDSRAEQLTAIVVQRADKNVPFFKNVVPRVAQEYNVGTAELANYIAFRLSLEGFDWWGTAANLQTNDVASWQVAVDLLFEHLDLKRLAETDRSLLVQALEVTP